MALCRALALSIVTEPGAMLDDEETERQAVVYLWAHSAPLDDVLTAVWRGDWPGIAEAWGDELPATWDAEGVLLELDRLARLVEAANFKVKPRPKAKTKGVAAADREPDNLIQPGWLAATAGAIMRETHLDEFRAVWGLPLARAIQYHHFAARSNLAWTVPADDKGGGLNPSAVAETFDRLAAFANAEQEDDEF